MYVRLVKQIEDMISEKTTDSILHPTVENYILIEEELESIEYEINRILSKSKDMILCKILQDNLKAISAIFATVKNISNSNMEIIRSSTWR